jgi:hypothetical protein
MHDKTYRSMIMMAGLAGALVACNGGGGGGQDTGGDAFGGEIEFRGELPLLPGLDVDTGWIPADSPASVRTTLSAGGAVTVTSRATTDGEAMTPVAGSGEIAMEGALTLEVSARIDFNGIEYEDVVQSFDYTIAPQTTTFEPFSLDQAVTLSADLPAQELGSVPIPAVPGASLFVEVTGGQVTTEFVGTCAQTADGFGQYAGTATMAGTIAAAATIEIDVLVATESFGPFAFDLPIPEIVSPLDLGTRSLATGEAADAMGVCDAAAGDDAAGSAEDTANAGTDDGAPMTSGGSDPADGDTTGGDTTGDDPSDTGSGPVGDPDYPSPDMDGCPPGFVAAGIDSPIDNGICLPPCGGAGDCPSGATGSAVGVCALNPASTQLPCASADDCAVGESCEGNTCVLLPPTYCALACDATAICPDAMTCMQGVCVYEL